MAISKKQWFTAGLVSLLCFFLYFITDLLRHRPFDLLGASSVSLGGFLGVLFAMRLKDTKEWTPPSRSHEQHGRDNDKDHRQS